MTGQDVGSTDANEEPGQHGDFASLDQFYEQTFDSLLAKAIMICGDQELAEQSVCDTYLEAHRQWEKIWAPWPWAVTVMGHRLMDIQERDRLRRDGERRHALEVVIPWTTLPEERAEVVTVLSALAALPRRQRQVIVLHVICDLTQREVAEMLGITRVTVASVLRDALEALRRRLGLTSSRFGSDRWANARRAPTDPPVITVREYTARRLQEATKIFARASRAEGQVREQVRNELLRRCADDQQER